MVTVKDNKIVLVYPSSDFFLQYPGPDFDLDGYHSIPPGLLSIATLVQETGFYPIVIDCRLYSKKEASRMLIAELDGAFAVGFSIMTCQIRHGLYLSNLVKKNSSLPVIWGGIHPTLFPEQTAENALIDYVIYGEGENSFIRLLNYIVNNRTLLESIRGLAWKREGRVIRNIADELVDINKLPLPNYELLDINKYIERRLIQGDRVRGLDIITSRGCPYRCTFCTNTFLLSRKWRPMALEKIIELIDKLVSSYHLNNLWFMDDFFFGQKERPLRLAQHLKENYHRISWEADIRVDNFKEGFVDDLYLEQLKDGGCHSLRMGAESGSNRVLNILKKDITVEETQRAVEQCIRHDIKPILFFITGIPGELKVDMLKTARFIFFLKKRFPQVFIFGPGMFRPYPGSELYEQVKRDGFQTPSSLEEWGNDLAEDLSGGYLDLRNLPWLKGQERFIEDIIFYVNMYLAYQGQHPYLGLRKIFGRIAGVRYRSNFWNFRVDARIVSWYKHFKHKTIRNSTFNYD